MTCKIKICGITNEVDLELIARSGADYGGVLVEIDSPRGLIFENALGLFINPPLPLVAVTLDRPVEILSQWAVDLLPAALQLHGNESPETVESLKRIVNCEIWKVIHLPAEENSDTVDVDRIIGMMREFLEAGVDRFLVDATIVREGKRHLGGTGKTVDWSLARTIRDRCPRPFIVAGGIHPGNVAEAVRIVHPDGIDLSSGVEREKGKKDTRKVLELIARVRAWERGDEIA